MKQKKHKKTKTKKKKKKEKRKIYTYTVPNVVTLYVVTYVCFCLFDTFFHFYSLIKAQI